MPISGYFDLPFAENGDLNTIPDATQPSGTVSYNQGFPVLYSTPVVSGGYNVPRTAINQVLNDITTAVQNWQQNTAAPFITTAMNGGTPYSYPKYALALKSGVVYASLQNSNTDTPPSTKWLPLPLALSTQGTTGTNHTYANADTGLMTLRSNAGALMVDTLPGTGTAVLYNGWNATVVNNDASGLLQIAVAAGANLNGSGTGTIILGPGQRCQLFCDGSNYWAEQLPARVRLGANTSFYVATTGNDANNGLAGGTPWLTIQHALNVLYNTLDFAGFTVTLNVADGTYTGAVAVNGNFTGAGTLSIVGNTTTPANCIISTTSNSCITINNSTCVINLGGFKLTTTTGGDALLLTQSAGVTLNGNMEFATVASGNSHIHVDRSNLTVTASYKISASAASHWLLSYKGSFVCLSAITITLTGTPAWSAAFCTANDNSDVAIGTSAITFSGAATGVRYNTVLNSTINTTGSGASYFPGNASGTTGTGGQYV